MKKRMDEKHSSPSVFFFTCWLALVHSGLDVWAGVKSKFQWGKMISVICRFSGVKMITVICNFSGVK
jgi:hypothetical protein